MEKALGVELAQAWERLEPRDKVPIVKQLAGICARLSECRFPSYGALYFRKDLRHSESHVLDDTFAIGPTTTRSWFDDRRDGVNVYRGPRMSASEFMDALVQREAACLRAFDTFNYIYFSGPGGYCPTHESKLAVLRDFEKIAQYVLPERESLQASILWHNDLHTDNIFVDANDPTQITCIIDWQAAPIYPMFLHAKHPSLIDFDGPKPEGFTKPSLPADIIEMSPSSEQAAKDLFVAQSLWVLYEVQIQMQAPDLLHAFQYGNTLPCRLLQAVGSVFDDGEPYVQSLLADVTSSEAWTKVAGENVPCPIQYSQSELRVQSEEFAEWKRDVDRRLGVIEKLGVYPGWIGAVCLAEFNEMKSRLGDAKAWFLDREAKTASEREAWERVWPFEDD